MRIESHPKSGPLCHLDPAVKLSETLAHWERPTPQLGDGVAAWV